MNRSRMGALIVAAVLVISIALFMSSRRNASQATPGTQLFPGIGTELSSLTALEVRKGSADPSVTLHKKDDAWVITQRGDYPADVSKLRKLLLSLSDAKIVEEKTSDPANYSLIGVDDPTKPTATGAQLTFTVKDGAHTLIVGKPSGESNFVRRGGEKTSYLVAPGIYVEAEPRLWIETKLIELATDSIDRIDYRPAAGASYSVHRIAPAPAPAPAASAAAAPQPPQPPEYVLEGAPAGRKPADSPTLAPSPATFGNVTADDVAQAADIDFSKPASTLVTLKDGSTVTFTGTVIGDKHWIEVAAPKDAALTSRAAGRAFQVPGYRYEGLFRSLEQLLVPKPAPPEKGAKPEAPALPSSKPTAIKPKAS